MDAVNVYQCATGTKHEPLEGKGRDKRVARLEGLEPPHPAPEASALSTELQAHSDILSIRGHLHARTRGSEDREIMDLEQRIAAVDQHNTEHQQCVRCVAAGLLPEAAPVFHGTGSERILLVGQAPGIVEVSTRMPFSGRAGGILMQWLLKAGFRDMADIRERIYFTSVTTCYPGKAKGGSGDRVPSRREVALCTPWRAEVFRLLQPEMIILVGGLALREYLPGLSLSEAIGSVFPTALGKGVSVVPLPHPSGQSRWLNDVHHREQLAAALHMIAYLQARAGACINRSQ